MACTVDLSDTNERKKAVSAAKARIVIKVFTFRYPWIYFQKIIKVAIVILNYHL